MITSKRISAFFIICAVLFASLFANALPVYATDDSSESTTTTTTTSSTTTTTTTPPQNGVTVSQVFCYGSNSKLYNKLIKYSEMSEKYTANVSVPLWMTSLEINIKSVSGAKVTIDGTEFSADGSLFTHTIEFDAATKYKTKTYTILIKKDDKQSTLTFNLAQSVFETKLENVYVDSKSAEGTNESGYKYTLPTGTTSCKIKLKTRSEEAVSMGKAGEELEKLELNSDKVFLEKVQLSEGENVFNISVTAPGTTINTTLTITVGEPVVSSEVSSMVSSDPVEENTSATDIPDFPAGIDVSSEPEESSQVRIPDDVKKSTSPLIWVLIGVVIAVVIGACIFMIASMGGGNKSRPSGNYNRPYGGNMYRAAPPPAPARRRDLGRFVDDDYGYDDYYTEPTPQYPEDNYYPNDEYYQDEGYYQDGKYHDDYSRDGYQRPPQRQQYQSQRRGNRNDYDEFYDDYYN